MTLYKLTRLLAERGFTLVKHYTTQEIWSNGEKYLTVPVNNDNVNISVAKDLLRQSMEA